MSLFCSDVPGRVFGSYFVNEFVELEYSAADKAILRELAAVYMEIAVLPQQTENRSNWQKLNDLRECRPLIWHNEICWNEMNVDDELTLRTDSEFSRRIEGELRRNIYLWRHMPGDMVVEPVIYSPAIVTNSGIGIDVSEETRATDIENQIVSHSFKPQISTFDDIEKIKTPVVVFEKKLSEETLQAYEDILGGIVPVKMRGFPGFWFAPWDDIVTLTGVQETLVNLCDEPEFMHALIGKITDTYISALKQYEAQGCIASNNSNFRIGSGAYGYTNDLPNGHEMGMSCLEIWGSSTPQIFTNVSPAMHDEFGIEYERKWLGNFGLAYYGCCEALHRKIDILRKIKNLRKISISPWADARIAAEQTGRDYVISLKPSPSIFAGDRWNIDAAIGELRRKLNETAGCNVEVVIKDISTVKRHPERLWEWVNTAHALVKNM